MKIHLLKLLTGLLLLPALTQAANEALVSTMVERSAQLQQLGPTDSYITGNGQHYQILSGTRAAEIKQNELPQTTLARIGGDKLIETKGSFIVYSVQQNTGSMVTINGATYPTAFNMRTGVVGIMPGTLNVKLKNTANTAAVAADYGLEIVRVFAHLKTAYFKIKPGQDVVSIVTALMADTRVARAEIEVIEYLNAPN